MKEYFSSKMQIIENEMQTNFPKSTSFDWIKETIGAEHKFDSNIWEKSLSGPFYELYNRGGKRIRPVLCILTHECLKGNNPEIAKLSIIPEIIHSGTLIIDDIEDNSEMRRGKECVHKIYGNPISINSANFIYFFAMKILQKSNLSDSDKIKVYNILTDELTKVHMGQGLDIYWSESKEYNATTEEYLQMCSYKTGSLLSCAIKIGAALAGADDEILLKLSSVATSIGVAFQIRDDILNLKPTSEWGKESGEDITEGKFTYMIADTLENANEQDKENLKSILKSNTKNRDKINEAIRILDKYDAFKKADNYSEQLILNSKNTIQELFDESKEKKIFIETLDYLISRNK